MSGCFSGKAHDVSASAQRCAAAKLRAGTQLQASGRSMSSERKSQKNVPWTLERPGEIRQREAVTCSHLCLDINESDSD